MMRSIKELFNRSAPRLDDRVHSQLWNSLSNRLQDELWMPAQHQLYVQLIGHARTQLVDDHE